MGLGDIAQDAIATASGGETHSTIGKFMSKFMSSSPNYVDTIDPMNTFDCTFEFWPGDDNEKKASPEDKALDIAEGALMNAADNLTGGLASSIKNSKKSLSKEYNSFFVTNNGVKSFLSYLLEGNMLNVEAGPHPTIDMSMYIQSITTPNINIQTGEVIKSPLGGYTVTGDITTPQANTLTMEILNTKAPLIERIFYPWMREVSLPAWVYTSQPYTTADITVSMTKHADVKYIFVGCRPTSIDTYNPSQELNGNLTRQVVFTFDYMFIHSDLKIMESVKDKMLGLASGALGDVAGTFGL